MYILIKIILHILRVTMWGNLNKMLNLLTLKITETGSNNVTHIPYTMLYKIPLKCKVVFSAALVTE
jgi:hypothetical protein